MEWIRDDLRLLRRSFDAASHLWIGATCAGVVATVAATIVGERIGGYAGYLFGEFRFEGQYAGVMTALSTFFLAAAGVSLFTIAWLFARTRSMHHLVLPWAIAAAGMLVLAADDLLVVHEIVAYRLEERGVPYTIGENLVLAVYVIGTLLVLPRLLETVRRYWRSMFPLAFGLAMFALSVVLDLVVPQESWLLAVTDRTGKVLGTTMMLVFAQSLLVAVAADCEPTAPSVQDAELVD